MGIRCLLKGLFKKGLMITWSDGRPYDVHYQKRTDAMDDIIKQKEVRDGNVAEDLRFYKGCEDSEVVK